MVRPILMPVQKSELSREAGNHSHCENVLMEMCLHFRM